MKNYYRIWTCDDADGIIVEVLNENEIEGIIKYFISMGYVLNYISKNLIRMTEKERMLKHGR